jgi:D-glycero-D-manno-heptose 1,7-bisphosphate phosphatase
VFLDRDGIINEKPAPGEYILCENEFRLLPYIADWIRLFNILGLLVIVITNQRGVALGRLTEDRLLSVHAKMLKELTDRNARIDDIFYCPHALDSCNCRKPKPGMIHAAQEKWNIDLENSLLIGDSECDELLAASCGIPFLRVMDGHIA